MILINMRMTDTTNSVVNSQVLILEPWMKQLEAKINVLINIIGSVLSVDLQKFINHKAGMNQPYDLSKAIKPYEYFDNHAKINAPFVNILESFLTYLYKGRDITKEMLVLSR